MDLNIVSLGNVPAAQEATLRSSPRMEPRTFCRPPRNGSFDGSEEFPPITIVVHDIGCTRCAKTLGAPLRRHADERVTQRLRRSDVPGTIADQHGLDDTVPIPCLIDRPIDCVHA